ncbi:hypothetical protein RMSM_04279 [Rhodopirellula maiorica SM1]|uniref:Uncharacterized protein n=1 Tax=Rhodopirellula maiorica SM1 TaxID=1265738 RepID=M5RY17_9BACT|nr:hypothetical protein [Rhodopirellula maiorica]EMI18804.1 hypothetical protein RMSM_04279 [Rhodopirellula maiorica SM1]
MSNMNGLLTAFAKHPDFTLQVFDDLIAFLATAGQNEIPPSVIDTGSKLERLMPGTDCRAPIAACIL